MNILSLIPEIYEKFSVFILAFTRISTLFSVFILFRRDYVNPRILIALSGILALYSVVLMPNNFVTYDNFSIAMFVQMFIQFLIGFMSGLILNLIYEVISAFGQIVSSQIGLGFASLIDPKLGSISSLTHFYVYGITLIFLLLNGHLFVIKTILDSFTFLPIGKSIFPEHIITDILSYSGIIFSESIVLSMTVVISILLTNLALAVMTKFAPQFNLFSIGISMSLIIGLLCIYITFQIFVDHGGTLVNQCLVFLQNILIKLK